MRKTFGSDPGWKGFHNRIVPIPPPTVTQDFGWSPLPGQAVAAATCGTPESYGLIHIPTVSYRSRSNRASRLVIRTVCSYLFERDCRPICRSGIRDGRTDNLDSQLVPAMTNGLVHTDHRLAAEVSGIAVTE